MKRYWMLLFWLIAGSASAQLQVQNARWQVIGGGAWCDAGRQLAEACNGKNYCQIYVDPRYLCGGDPAVGRAKTLNVNYTCAGRAQPTLAFADGSQAVLRCGGNNGGWNPPPPTQASGDEHGKLQIYEARWEVLGGGAHCDATAQLIRACDGTAFCQMFVDPRYLCNGDPAPGQEKRLDIRYACNGERQAPVGFNDFSEVVLRCHHGGGGNHSGGNLPPNGYPPVSNSGGLQVRSARWEQVGGGGWCDAAAQMREACDGRRHCRVPVDPQHLCNGDPAPGQLKSLDVRYSCNGRNRDPISFPDFANAILTCE